MIRMPPAVFAAGRNYQIMVPVVRESLMFVRVGDECFYDESNGIMRSSCAVHRMTVPVPVLDQAGSYTLCEREMTERKPYYPTSERLTETTFPFRPVPAEAPSAIHIADAHSCAEGPLKAAGLLGKADFLILNGDIPVDATDTARFEIIYEIAAKVTGGEIPVVFTRGNHDIRGSRAETYAEYTPCVNGNSYYTFRLGSLWGLVLDCGEDKPDDCPDYGFTVCGHPFRQRQIRFMEDLVRHADREYLAPDVTRRLVLCHVPFMHRDLPPRDSERALYGEWCRLLREEIRPDLVLCGHTHHLEKHLPGDPWLEFEVGCPVVVGAALGREDHYYAEGRLTFERDRTHVCYADNRGMFPDAYTLYLREDGNRTQTNVSNETEDVNDGKQP